MKSRNFINILSFILLGISVVDAKVTSYLFEYYLPEIGEPEEVSFETYDRYTVYKNSMKAPLASNEGLYRGQFIFKAANNYQMVIEGVYKYFTSTEEDIFKLQNVEKTRFIQDIQGNMKISAPYLMPTLRNVPLFPRRSLQVGETWTYMGEEVHQSLLAEDTTPYTIPIEVHYTFQDIQTIKSDIVAVLNIEYGGVIDFVDKPITQVKVSVKSNFLWNLTKGRPYSYKDTYKYFFFFPDGQYLIYNGTSGMKTKDLKVYSTNKYRKINNTLEKKISKGEIITQEDNKAITIRLDDILFDINKATIKDPNEQVLYEIASLLARYPDLLVEVSGYTDNTGAEDFNQELSEKRAKAVVTFLKNLGVNTKRVYYVGYGSQYPIADNATPEGKSKNRRVEIKLITKD